MNDVHRRSDVGEVESLLDRGIAASDHCDRSVLEEEAVAGRAGRHSGSLEPFFGREPRYLADAPVAMMSASQV